MINQTEKKTFEQNVENFSLSLEFRFGLSRFFHRIQQTEWKRGWMDFGHLCGSMKANLNREGGEIANNQTVHTKKDDQESESDRAREREREKL